ncbi:MAG: hypothetical protein ACOCVX_04125 [Bacteroidales bacterium]
MKYSTFVIIFIFSVNFNSIGQIQYSSELNCGTGLYNYIDDGLGMSFSTSQLMYPFASFFGGSGTPVAFNYSQNIHFKNYYASVFLGLNYYPAEMHRYNIDVNHYTLFRYGIETGYSIITKPKYRFTPGVMFGSLRVINSTDANAPGQWLAGVNFRNEFELNEQISLLLTPGLQVAFLPEHKKNDLEYSKKMFIDLPVSLGLRYYFGSTKTNGNDE